METQWVGKDASGGNGCYVRGEWCLTVIFPHPDSLARNYFLTGPDTFEEILTDGGIYTALDIASGFIDWIS